MILYPQAPLIINTLGVISCSYEHLSVCLSPCSLTVTLAVNMSCQVSYRIFGWGGEARWAIKAPPPRHNPSEMMYVYFNEIIEEKNRRINL